VKQWHAFEKTAVRGCAQSLEGDFVRGAVREFGRARALVGCYSAFEVAAVQQIRGDAGRAEGMAVRRAA
jgi:hypothetical protein